MSATTTGAVDIDAIPTHLTEVVRTERISESFVRVTFGGGLERFHAIGPDDFVYVLLPPPGAHELTIDASFTWRAYAQMPQAERPIGAYYTVRRHRPEAGELDCDVFLHEPPGAVSGWAIRCAPGDPVALWGPRTAWTPPPATTDWLLVADETGLPAVAAILETRPADVTARVFLEASSTDAYHRLFEWADVELTWLLRPADEAGTTTLLVDAMRSAPCRASTYAWGGAEHAAMTSVREHLQHDRALDPAQVSMTAYWRRPVVAAVSGTSAAASPGTP